MKKLGRTFFLVLLLVISANAKPQYQLVTTFAGQGQVNAIKFSPVTDQLMFADSSGLVLYDLSTRKQTRLVGGVREAVTDFCWSDDGRQVGSVNLNGSVRFSSIDKSVVGLSYSGIAGKLRHIVLLPDSGSFVVAGESGIMHYWQAGTGREYDTWSYHTGAITDILITTDGRLLSCGADNRLFIRRSEQNAMPDTVAWVTNQISALALNRADGEIALIGLDGKVQVVAEDSLTLLRTIVDSGRMLHSGSYHPSGRWIGITDDFGFTILNSVTGDTVVRKEGVTGKRELAFSTTGQWMAVTSGGKVDIYEDQSIAGTEAVNGTEPAPARRRVLGLRPTPVIALIGNSDYLVGDSIKSVNSAREDVAYFNNLVGSRLTSSPTTIQRYENMNRAEMRDLLLGIGNTQPNIAQSIQAQMTDIIIYYSGLVENDSNRRETILVPAPSRLALSTNEPIPVKIMLNRLQLHKPRSVVMIIDADIPHQFQLPKGVCVITRNSGMNSNSLDPEMQVGRFTRWVAAGLGGLADLDGDLAITSGELVKFLSTVPELAGFNPRLIGDGEVLIVY